jgi:hypothetical protein
MPWAKVDIETNLVTDLFENEPTLDPDEVGKVSIVEVEDDVDIGDEVDLANEPAATESEQPPPNAVPPAG